MEQLFKRRWVYHSLIWLGAIILFYYLIQDQEISARESLRQAFLVVLPIAYLSYGGFLAKALFFDKRKYLAFAMSLIFVIASAVLLLEALKYFDINSSNGIIQNTTNSIFILLFAMGFQYFKRGIVNQHQLQELKAKTADTELNALKAQINPHFLFNTLNNIYGMNQLDSQKGSEMILELSDVMRYHLEFSKMGRVKLEDEIQLIESYIRLESLRLMGNCNLRIETEAADKDLMISPLLFLPFVENAFKHGTHPIHPCFIFLTLKSEGNKVLFELENSLIENRKVVKTNIGLENTRRRLELMYPSRHELDISQTNKSYKVNLEIRL